MLINELTTRDFYACKRAKHQARDEKPTHPRDDGKFRRNMAQEAISNLSAFAHIVLDSF